MNMKEQQCFAQLSQTLTKRSKGNYKCSNICNLIGGASRRGLTGV